MVLRFLTDCCIGSFQFSDRIGWVTNIFTHLLDQARWSPARRTVDSIHLIQYQIKAVRIERSRPNVIRPAIHRKKRKPGVAVSWQVRIRLVIADARSVRYNLCHQSRW